MITMTANRLDPQITALLKQMQEQGVPPVETMTPTQARETKNPVFFKLAAPAEDVAGAEDLLIPGKGVEIPIRVYTPLGRGPFPILVYFHGGGWLIGNLDTHDNVCRSLANRADCLVVSVDYRLAPENKFPAAVEDAYAATRWVVSNASRINGDAGRLAVGGDSSGGNLAAVVCLLARENKTPSIGLQVLVYPVTDVSSLDTDSYHRHGEGYVLTRNSMRYYRDHYITREEELINPLASPLLAENLKGLPPAFILAAEFDVLLDEVDAYARRLKDAGVSVRFRLFNGMIHGFFCWGGVVYRAGDAIDEIAAALCSAGCTSDITL